MDIDKYRSSTDEQQRLEDLLGLLPRGRTTILEIGARDGHHTRKLMEIFDAVTALDLQRPSFEIQGVTTVEGDVTQLNFPDSSFDCVLCAEVLEHVADLEGAVREISRVARYEVLIGVPYKQDTRIGRLTCLSCGQINPVYGHINVFDEKRLQDLFKGWEAAAIHYVGISRSRTNTVSTRLMDYAGNPWGTYGQDEPCIRCGSVLTPPITRSMSQKVAGRVALILNQLQYPFVRPTGNWIHLLFRKSA